MRNSQRLLSTMRHLFGVTCLCALGLVPAVGCLQGPWFESGSCQGVVCPSDGNECTHEYCRCDGWWCSPTCVSAPVDNGTDCTYDGLSGVCVSGECGENLCEGVACDDADACTDDMCDYVDGTCDFTPVDCDDRNECTDDTCKPADGCKFTPVEDGEFCYEHFHPEIGVCKAGACVVAMEACTNTEDLALVCDAGFMEEVEACADPAGILVAPCLVENTGASADCASCYGTAVRCIGENCFHVCPTAPDSQECEDCYVENGCIALLDECTGDLESACDGGDAMSGVGMFEVQP